jgi:hypothetical protein
VKALLQICSPYACIPISKIMLHKKEVTGRGFVITIMCFSYENLLNRKLEVLASVDTFED